MAFYRTFIADPLGALPQKLAWGIQSQLAALFSPCTSDDFEGNWVYFAEATSLPVKHELLVYFLPKGVSVIKKVPKLTKAPDLSAGGNTVYLAGASEVYVSGDDPVALAKLAFHELMHNRLKLDDRHLHGQGGLAGGTINPSTTLTTSNIRAMKAVIKRPIAQWTDGFSMLANGVNDPLSEYYKP